MSMEFANRICPNCTNPNYVIFLGDFSKAYKYKCMNCNGYFNDIDFEKEPLQPILKSECMNSKVDMVEVVRCKDCKWWDKIEDSPYGYCHACKHSCLTEHWDIRIYREYKGDWFCADGERRIDDA